MASTITHGQNTMRMVIERMLLLPMGRHGPAFLAYPNFKAFLGWNSAMVYSTTVAYFATRDQPARRRSAAATDGGDPHAPSRSPICSGS